MLEVIFGSKSSKDIGLITSDVKRPILPPLRKKEVEVLGKDGTYDFGNNDYDKRTIEVTFSMIEKDKKYLTLKAREIASWLSSKVEKQLIFSDEIDKYYLAKTYSNIDFDRIVYAGTFTVIFECQPFAILVDNTENINLDSDLLLESDIRLGDEFSFSITTPKTIEINNFGTVPVKPIIRVEGSFNTLTIGEFNYNESISNSTIEIDCNRYVVRKGTTNKLNVTNNRFIELEEGLNSISIGGTNLNCTVSFIFNPKFL